MNRPYLQFRRGIRRPWIRFVIRGDDLIGASAQKLAQRADIQSVVLWGETGKVARSEPKQTYGGRQAPAMLRVQWIFEALLKVNEGAGRLDQPFKEIYVARIALQPKLFEDIVRFVITLFVPALKERAVKPVFCDVRLSRVDIVITQLSHQPRNPLAFGHGGLNLMAAQRMSKPLIITLTGTACGVRGYVRPFKSGNPAIARPHS